MGLAFRIISVLFALWVITSCGDSRVVPDQPDIVEADRSSPEYITSLLESAARTADPLESLALKINAAELLALSGDTAWARNIMDGIPVNLTYLESDEVNARRTLVQSYIYDSDGYSRMAYENMSNPNLLASLPTLPLELQISILEFKAQLLFNMELYDASILERIKLSELLPSNDISNEINQDKIWTALMEIPLESLSMLALTNTGREALGWFTLASMTKNTQTNLRQQLLHVDKWILEWPDHPASLRPPADLQTLKQLVDNQAKQIGILLPFSGQLSSAANAILDGFMSAYYELKRNEGEAPTLRLYDTNQGDIQQIYEQAQFDGAELIIGPLSKDNIQQLMALPAVPVPILALNSVDHIEPTLENLYQFGLGVEDEAEQAAEKAWRDGHRRALIIAPNSAWGDRAAQTFEFTWIGLGGEMSKDYRFEDTNDYSEIIKNALQLDQSRQRAREILNRIGHIEFEPRRRQDIDTIFLAANAKQARQVKPTLSFHYASDLPVYATSQAYSGAPSPKRDQDMNGVRFSTLPWFFDKQSSERKAIVKNADANPSLQPLYALGVDSFHIYPRLKQLEMIKEAHFYGETGQLRLDQQKRIKRKQVWAEFYKGKPRPLNDSK